MKTIIVILGAARSGSTLLAKALGGNESCFTIGEINRFNLEINNPKTHCGCGEKLNNCKFWLKILDDLNLNFGKNLEDSKNDFDIGIFSQLTIKDKIFKLFPTLVSKKKYFNSKIENEIQNTFTLYKRIMIDSESEILIDSTKGLLRGLILESRAPSNFQFIFINLVRDGRAVLNSSLKSSYFINHVDGKREEYFSNVKKNPKKIINSWMYINIRNLIILKLFRNSNSYYIKYEKFTESPKYYINMIYKRLNLKYDPIFLDLEKNYNHILGGNSSRINAKKINKSDQVWMSKLDKEILKSFDYRAGWLNKILGYK